MSKVRLPEPEKGRSVLFNGNYEVTVQMAANPGAKNVLEVKEATTGKKMWSLELDEPLRFTLSNALVLQHPAKGKAAEQLVQTYPQLKDLLEETKNRQNAEILEVRNVATGKQLGCVVVEGRGLVIRTIRLAGRTLFVEETNNRTLAYSLDTGERSGQQFGRVMSISTVRGLVAVQNEAGRIAVLDRGMEILGEFSYPGTILLAAFDSEGKRIVVLTNKEEVFIDDLP